MAFTLCKEVNERSWELRNIFHNDVNYGFGCNGIRDDRLARFSLDVASLYHHYMNLCNLKISQIYLGPPNMCQITCTV